MPKKQTTTEPKTVELKEENQSFSPDAVVAIETSRLTPSPFEPQARRRARFKDADLESLGNSIQLHGLAQPILVRPIFAPPDSPSFEIVFGERRWLASKVKRLQTVNCFVRALSDAASLELQYDENHKQVGSDPLDDAFFFKFLKEKEGYTDEQLADRLGTTRKNVTDKLKLNDLIVPAVAELNDGKLPLKHAYYLAKFSAGVQQEIVREGYAYKYQDKTEAAVSYNEFKEEVEANILRKLDGAPFDREDARLHVKGLLCADCPERTGYAPALFGDLNKDDSCLNKSCFEVKSNTHLRLQRDAIAFARPNPTNQPLDKIVAEVPLVTDRNWSDDDKSPFREKPLTNQKFLPAPECAASELSLIVEGARKGEQTYICKDAACEIHNPKPVFNDSQLEEKELEFNLKVAHLAQEKVFARGVEFFDDYKSFWAFDDLIQQLIVEFFWALSTENKEFICKAVKEWKDAPTVRSHKWDVQRFVRTLDKNKQSGILFLLSHAGGRPARDFEKLAKDYARTDYKILDAEARLELAPAEFKSVAATYLEAVLTGIPSPVPAFWWGFDELPDDEPETAIQAAELSHAVH